jgi:hypothetical protein
MWCHLIIVGMAEYNCKENGLMERGHDRGKVTNLGLPKMKNVHLICICIRDSTSIHSLLYIYRYKKWPGRWAPSYELIWSPSLLILTHLSLSPVPTMTPSRHQTLWFLYSLLIYDTSFTRKSELFTIFQLFFKFCFFQRFVACFISKKHRN